jgi:hypothetical protein
MEVIIEETPLIRVDGVLYPKDCENNVGRAKPEHIANLKETLRILGAVAWPALAQKLLDDDAEQVIDLMETYRRDYLAHEETDRLIETTFNSARRVVLTDRLRELEWERDESLHRLRVKLVGEERVRVRDLEIEQATQDFSETLYLEDIEEDENEDLPDYVIWE